MAGFFTRIFGSRNQRNIKRYGKFIDQANSLESTIEQLSDEALRAQTDKLKKQLADGVKQEKIIPEAFATVREAAKRTMGMRHYDVQLIGGLVLNSGQIAEMRTGEGKTLMSTLPAYLNALSGLGVHVITVNEYLAERDALWMTPIYEFLGMRVGVIKSGQSPQEKQDAYAADVTYGTNNEFGFDYLRDNLVLRLEDRMQRELNFAIVDEVDSILIDEARTPLIISGASEESTDLYLKIDKVVPRLTEQKEEDGPGDYSLDEKSKQAYLTEEGHQTVEEEFSKLGLLNEGESLYDAANITLVHHLNACLRAHKLYKKDVAYIVKDDEVIIVDEFTGRTMPGRRWSDGLHQAVEAKEGVSVNQENQTIASVTFQNYFRMYNKLSGMTGTADTEAFEFQSIYGLEVVVIPTHKPMIRDDKPDLMFLTKEGKYKAIVEDIIENQKDARPVLVGTTSIETSEILSRELSKAGIKHEVLNAKQHEREAQIVAQAGSPAAVTIATNMAGRGTDIVLGGSIEAELVELDKEEQEKARTEWKERHQQVLDAGGLHIIGTERHESRRIDNQLRGRSGRQGDPGSSRFFLSIEDDLMRIFGQSERVKTWLARAGMKEDEAIESGFLTKQIERAQRKVESHNFDIRKDLLEYDDVSNDQRMVIYEQRLGLLEDEDISDAITGIREEVVADLVERHMPAESVEERWDVDGLQNALLSNFNANLPIKSWLEANTELKPEAVAERAIEEVAKLYEEKVTAVGPQIMRHLEKVMMLQHLDRQWREHLGSMDYLRQGIRLRSYAQKNPKQEYKREAFAMFGEMLDRVKEDVVTTLSKVAVRTEEEVEALEAKRRQRQPDMQFVHPSASAAAGSQSPQQQKPAEATEPFVREDRKIGRNEPCPCGSGKKYKRCHGALT